MRKVAEGILGWCFAFGWLITGIVGFDIANGGDGLWDYVSGVALFWSAPMVVAAVVWRERQS